MTKISLNIPDELLSRIDMMARAKQISRAALLREALEEMLEGPTHKARRSFFEQSADLCGKGCSGLGDLASNPRHLDGFSS